MTLARTGGGVVEGMTVPFRSQFAARSDSGLLELVAPADLSRCRFVFNPSTLGPGGYECRAILLDWDQREMASRSVAFERSPDAR